MKERERTISFAKWLQALAANLRALRFLTHSPRVCAIESRGSLFRLVKKPIGNWTLHSVLSSLQEHKYETH